MSASPKSPKGCPAATAASAGIPHVLEGEVLIAPYNDLATVEALLAVYADELAAVIVEPFQRLISPPLGFLPGLRTLTQRSEEHTSELQSRLPPVCRLLRSNKKNSPTEPCC